MPEPALLTDDGLALVKAEALDPELSRDTVVLGDKEYQVRLVPLRVERKILALVTPHLGTLEALEEGGMGAIGKLLETATDVLPEVVAAAFAPQGVTREWLEENAATYQLVDAVQKQLIKNQMADLLGKVSRGAARPG